MNIHYEALFRELALPQALLDCAVGRIQLPIASMAAPAEWFGFHPALCPIWSDASVHYYLGYWKHWFSSRPASFVAMYVRTGRKVKEIARTPDQLFCHVILAAICVHDGVTVPIKQFASAVGITNLPEIDKVSLKTGDNPHGYSAISQFGRDLPLASVTDVSQYTGRFPSGAYSGQDEWWKDSCLFEVSDEILASWPGSIAKPPWFQPRDRVVDFERFLQKNDFHGAWLTLNSPGWSISAAKTAIAQLASVANDPRFSILARAWISVAQERSGGY